MLLRLPSHEHSQKIQPSVLVSALSLAQKKEYRSRRLKYISKLEVSGPKALTTLVRQAKHLFKCSVPSLLKGQEVTKRFWRSIRSDQTFQYPHGFPKFSEIQRLTQGFPFHIFFSGDDIIDFPDLNFWRAFRGLQVGSITFDMTNMSFGPAVRATIVKFLSGNPFVKVYIKTADFRSFPGIPASPITKRTTHLKTLMQFRTKDIQALSSFSNLTSLNLSRIEFSLQRVGEKGECQDPLLFVVFCDVLRSLRSLKTCHLDLNLNGLVKAFCAHFEPPPLTSELSLKLSNVNIRNQYANSQKEIHRLYQPAAVLLIQRLRNLRLRHFSVECDKRSNLDLVYYMYCFIITSSNRTDLKTANLKLHSTLHYKDDDEPPLDLTYLWSSIPPGLRTFRLSAKKCDFGSADSICQEFAQKNLTSLDVDTSVLYAETFNRTLQSLLNKTKKSYVNIGQLVITEKLLTEMIREVIHSANRLSFLKIRALSEGFVLGDLLEEKSVLMKKWEKEFQKRNPEKKLCLLNRCLGIFDFVVKKRQE